MIAPAAEKNIAAAGEIACHIHPAIKLAGNAAKLVRLLCNPRETPRSFAGVIREIHAFEFPSDTPM